LEIVIGHVLRRYEQYGVDRLTTANSSNLMAGTTADPVVSTLFDGVSLWCRPPRSGR